MTGWLAGSLGADSHPFPPTATEGTGRGGWRENCTSTPTILANLDGAAVEMATAVEIGKTAGFPTPNTLSV